MEPWMDGLDDLIRAVVLAPPEGEEDEDGTVLECCCGNCPLPAEWMLARPADPGHPLAICVSHWSYLKVKDPGLRELYRYSGRIRY